MTCSLHIRQVPISLRRDIKVAAARAGMTLQAYCMAVLAQAVKGKPGRSVHTGDGK